MNEKTRVRRIENPYLLMNSFQTNEIKKYPVEHALSFLQGLYNHSSGFILKWKFDEPGNFLEGYGDPRAQRDAMELDQEQHPFFIGTQAHPEFKSKLLDAAPLFKGLMAAAIEVSK